MEDRPRDITALLEKYLRNECGAAELNQLRRYLNTPEGKAVFRKAMDRESSGFSERTIDPGISARMLRNLQANIPGSSTHREPSNRFYNSSAWLIAATLSGLLFLAVMGWWFYPATQSTPVFSTGPGQKRTIVLPDGSLITLNGNSSIYSDFTTSRRHIELEGEAYFDVKRDTLRPFFVKTAQIEIEVLGTAFNVKSYSDDDAVETTLIRGLVEVKNLSESHKNEVLTLNPREQAIFSRTSLSLNKKEEVKAAALWHVGHLEFEDEPLRRILPELEKWYNVKIEWDDHVGDCRFSMNIEDETLEEVAKLFETTTSAKIQRNRQGIRIGGKLCE